MQKIRSLFSEAVTPSIAIKLALVITTVVIGGMALLSLLILGNQSNILGRQAESYASALGDQLSLAALEPLLANDVDSLKQLTSNLAQNEGVEGVAIFSDQSDILAAIGDIPAEDPTALSVGAALYWYSGENKEHELSSYISTISFRELTVGYSVLTFDHSFMSAAYVSTLRTISAITVLMLVLGVVVAVALGNRLSRPIKQLVEGTKEISRGNYKFRFDEYRRDELGQLMISMNTMTKGLLKKEHVEKTFSRYVSSNVADRVMDDFDKTNLGGRHVDATVLFADIAGFSRLSEKLEPEEINTLLNDYFTLIDAVAERHQGHIDKYIGDCAMILFGAPVNDDKHGIHGVNCAAEIQQVISDFNRTRESQGKIVVEFSVAVNSGTMLAGNMGSEKRMEYTVIGDAVNIAARLSSIAVAGQILVSRELHDWLLLDKSYDTGLLKTLKLRGKTEPMEVWEVKTPRIDVLDSEYTEVQLSSAVH